MRVVGRRNLRSLLLFLLLAKQACVAFVPKICSDRAPGLLLQSASNSGAGEVDLNLVPKQERTFYDILGASPNASKMELKQSYIKLARVTHPDALIGTNQTVVGDGVINSDFSDIAQAWKVLSNEKDRRRYDRTLVAQDFKKNVEKVASNVVETAGPHVKKAFDDFAMPFLRRTTVTTVATVSAAVDILGNSEKLDLGTAVASGMKAAKAAGRVVDGIESLEKSQELEERANKEMKKAEKIEAVLNQVIDQRINISLATPDSCLSSSEALNILDRFLNSTKSSAVMVNMKKTIERDINELKLAEKDYTVKRKVQVDAIEKSRFAQVALKQAARDAKQAVQAEIKARKLLEEAQKRVSATKLLVNDFSRSFAKLQAAEAKLTNEVETVAALMAKRQEVVRQSLRKRQLAVKAERLRSDKSPSDHVAKVVESDHAEVLDQIGKLREEELVLRGEIERRLDLVGRLRARAEKLKLRAAQSEGVPGQGEAPIG